MTDLDLDNVDWNDREPEPWLRSAQPNRLLARLTEEADRDREAQAWSEFEETIARMRQEMENDR